MDETEIRQLHARDACVHEAIHDSVHHAACRHNTDHMHPRIEIELCRVSWEVTRQAQSLRDSEQAD